MKGDVAWLTRHARFEAELEADGTRDPAATGPDLEVDLVPMGRMMPPASQYYEAVIRLGDVSTRLGSRQLRGLRSFLASPLVVPEEPLDADR